MLNKSGSKFESLVIEALNISRILHIVLIEVVRVELCGPSSQKVRTVLVVHLPRVHNQVSNSTFTKSIFRVAHSKFRNRSQIISQVGINEKCRSHTKKEEGKHLEYGLSATFDMEGVEVELVLGVVLVPESVVGFLNEFSAGVFVGLRQGRVRLVESTKASSLLQRLHSLSSQSAS